MASQVINFSVCFLINLHFTVFPFSKSQFHLFFYENVFLLPGFKVTELPFFASKVRLGRCGIEEILPLGPLNEFERSMN